MQPFFQDAPRLKNQFSHDPSLQESLPLFLGQDCYQANKNELERLGERAVNDLLALAEQAEREPPVHIPFDPWGRRIDILKVSPAWDALADAAAQEGIVATGYERKYGAKSRVLQFTKLYLYHASSAFFSCPLAMTDGAARALELYGDESLKQGAFKHLTSRDPKKFWTSGQWMTERTGGSDVSGTSTVAKPLGGDRYALYGTKWFTSATTSQMAMTLARIEGAESGSRGLSLFYVELRDPKTGQLQNIELHRLKDKLGTKALPTAELTMHGTPAKLVGGEGGGVKKIASLFNITRIYNSVCALSASRRALALALEYSRLRTAFGKKILAHPLHAETLAQLFQCFEGDFQLTFHLAQLLGKEECGEASEEESALLRLLTPVAKLFTAKHAMEITSEVIEVFGGAGYVEDTGMPKWHRDAQVFSIWEGTTNVLSLDMLRAMEKENAFPAFAKDVKARLARVEKEQSLAPSCAALKESYKKLEAYLPLALQAGPDGMQTAARSVAFSLGQIYSAGLMLENAMLSKSERLKTMAKRYAAIPLALADPSEQARKENNLILGV